MTIKIPGHHSSVELTGPSWEEFVATHRSPRPADDIASALREDFYVPEALRIIWNGTDPALRVEIAATHLQFLPSRSLGAMHRILAKLGGDAEPSFSKVVDTIVRGTGDSEHERARFEGEVAYRMEVQLFARRGCRFSGSDQRGPFGIRETLELAEVIRGECVRASSYLQQLYRVMAAESLAASRGEDVDLGHGRPFTPCDAATLSVIAQGRLPFSVEEDRLLLSLAAAHQDSGGRVLWGRVVEGMHEAFPDRLRTAPLYQQRRYKLL